MAIILHKSIFANNLYYVIIFVTHMSLFTVHWNLFWFYTAISFDVFVNVAYVELRLFYAMHVCEKDVSRNWCHYF